MQNIQHIELNEQNREEVLPGFSEEFPYIATCARLDTYRNPDIPWHWHRQAELFYIKSGSLEYTTPHGTWLFTEGMGGMVNSNVLHRSRRLSSQKENIQLLHIFDPSFLSGGGGNQMENKYILPLISDRKIEMIALHSEKMNEKKIIEQIRQTFAISDQEWGYEFRLRASLTQIWLDLLQIVQTEQIIKKESGKADEKIKCLMIYVHEHYKDPISIDELAESVFISKRVCYRLFQENLHMTPVEYIHSYRLQRASQMLVNSGKTITEIAQECGFGSSSYFGKLFRKKMKCTPEQYRRK